jgi:hypothetical protein
MQGLGNGLSDADRHVEALSVREAELSVERRLGASEESILITQNNLAISYKNTGRLEECLSLRREVYSGRLALSGEQHRDTLAAALNLSVSLVRFGETGLQHFEEGLSLLRRTIPMARGALGHGDLLTLQMSLDYAYTLYKYPGATLDDRREAVTMLEDIEPIARRVLGGAHPTTSAIEHDLRAARAALRAREQPSEPENA